MTKAEEKQEKERFLADKKAREAAVGCFVEDYPGCERIVCSRCKTRMDRRTVEMSVDLRRQHYRGEVPLGRGVVMTYESECGTKLTVHYEGSLRNTRLYGECEHAEV